MPADRPNVLGSFLGGDQMEKLCSLLGKELVGDFGAGWRSSIFGQALLRINEPQGCSSVGCFLQHSYGDGPYKYQVAAQIEASLIRLNLSKVIEEDGGNRNVFIGAIVNRIAHVVGEEARIALASSLIRLADWYGTHDGTETDAIELLNVVLAYGYP